MGLDTVEIVLRWEASFGLSIADADAMMLQTPRGAIDLIAKMLGAQDPPNSPCLTLRAFHCLRRGLAEAAGVARHRIRPTARLKDLVRTKRHHVWLAVRSRSGLPSLPHLGWFSPHTVADLARWTVLHAATELKRPGEPWTRSQIRTVVRAAVTDITGLENFSDDDEFIRDLGLD